MIILERLLQLALTDPTVYPILHRELGRRLTPEPPHPLEQPARAFAGGFTAMRADQWRFNPDSKVLRAYLTDQISILITTDLMGRHQITLMVSSRVGVSGDYGENFPSALASLVGALDHALAYDNGLAENAQSILGLALRGDFRTPTADARYLAARRHNFDHAMQGDPNPLQGDPHTGHWRCASCGEPNPYVRPNARTCPDCGMGALLADPQARSVTWSTRVGNPDEMLRQMLEMAREAEGARVINSDTYANFRVTPGPIPEEGDQ